MKEVVKVPMDQALVERVLTYLTFSEEFEPNRPTRSAEDIANGWSDDAIERFAKYGSLPLSHFNGAEVISSGKWLNSSPNDMLTPDEDLASLNIGNWEFAAVCDPYGVPKSSDLALYKLIKVRKVPMSEFRGVNVKWRSGNLAEIAQAVIYNSGKFSTQKILYERFRGQWEAIYAGSPIQEMDLKDKELHRESSLIEFGKSHALTRWYDWRVDIGFQIPGRGSLPSIAIPTSAGGARSAFKLRDIPPGKSRREALRHWVQMHHRQSEPDPITIWPYLRGAEEFNQNGMKCRIVPSQYDMKKAAEYQSMMAKNQKGKRLVI